MSPVLRRHDQLVLGRSRIPARARRWPGEDHVALLVLLDPLTIAAPRHFDEWLSQLAPQGITTVRTGALSSRQAAQAEAAGFECIQELALLEARAPLESRPLDGRRIDRRTSACRHGRSDQSELELLADIDRAAFGDPWRLDAAMLADVCDATPAHRARVVRDGDHLLPRAEPVGFLISGRAGRTGYLQRLAVHPAHQRRGVAAALVADSLVWLRRWRCDRVLVNTHVDNDPALHLYRSFGFADLPERLRVFEATIPAVPAVSS